MNNIEQIEKDGQRDLCKGNKFPLEVDDDLRCELQSAGFVFGDAIDDLFQQVRLPRGWKIKGQTDDFYWSDILDERGKRRGVIFYKAAPHNTRAFAHPV